MKVDRRDEGKTVLKIWGNDKEMSQRKGRGGTLYVRARKNYKALGQRKGRRREEKW